VLTFHSGTHLATRPPSVPNPPTNKGNASLVSAGATTGSTVDEDGALPPRALVSPDHGTSRGTYPGIATSGSRAAVARPDPVAVGAAFKRGTSTLCKGSTSSLGRWTTPRPAVAS
jgi:hypothetical protein